MVFFDDKDEDGQIMTELQTDDPQELEVRQRLWYYPFGMQMDGIVADTTEPHHAYRYNGKELDEVSQTYEYGFRYYDPTIGKFTGVDPIAAKYASISPYAYVANNPLIFIDPDGRQIKPVGGTAFNYIKWGLSVDEAKYLRLNDNGFVDAGYLRQGLNDLGTVGGNFEALLAIAEDESITEVFVAEGFNVINHNGEEQYIDFGAVTVESEADLMWGIEGAAYEAEGISKEKYIEMNGYSTEAKVSGFLGVTLYGELAKDGGGYGKSTTGNTEVIINSRSPAKIGTGNQAHENYGHNYFRILGKPHSHGAIKSLTSDDPQNNRPLENQIYQRTKEAESNYDKHH